MSLRTRVLLAMSVIATVVLGGAVLTTRLAEQRLMDQIDDRLTGVPAFFGRGFAPPAGQAPDPRFDDSQRPRGFNEFYLAQINQSGTVVARSRPNISRRSLPAPVIDVARARQSARAIPPKPYTVAARTTDLRYRVLARAEPTTGDIFLLAAPLSAVDASTSEIQSIAWGVAGLALAVLALVTWWVLRLGVRPLKRMASAAVTVGEDDLGRRVPDAPVGTEAGDLSRSINNMLGRIEESFSARAATDARLRRFVGDASHELRTPVQTIRGYSELYAAGALGETAALDDAMRRTGQESVRMATLIDDLLTLARFDQHRPLQSAPVDLLALASDALADAHAIQPGRTTTIETTGAGDPVVSGDEHLLRQVFANVIGNALVHTPSTSSVTVTIATDEETVTVTIADAGPGMDAETATRAFERFVRADPARTREHGGSGLGLAIAHDAVEAHGGSVTLRSDLDGGTVVEVRLRR